MAGSLLLFQAWACHYFCMATNLSLLYVEDSWPSLPRIHAFFAGILSPKEINKCFCTGLGTRVLRIIKGFSQGSYATPIMALVAQHLGDVNVAKLRRMYKRLSMDEKDVVDYLVRSGIFANCVYQRFKAACPPPSK